MHSSRMRTARSSNRRGVSTRHLPGTRHPPWDQTPPGPDPLWDQAPPLWDQAPPGPGTHLWDQAPPVDRQTPVNILPCPKLRLRAVIIRILSLHSDFTAVSKYTNVVCTYRVIDRHFCTVCGLFHTTQ